MSEDLSRRHFFRNTAGVAMATGPAVISALGQNNKTNLGVIGGGGRGNYLMDMLYLAKPENVAITWVCDTYKGNLNRAKDKVQTKEGSAPKAVADYKEILADKSMDAVIIATPEHLHYPMAMDALKAGKNIYLEKPIAHTIEEGAEIVKARRRPARSCRSARRTAATRSTSEGEGDGGGRHDRRVPLRARLLVSQLPADQPGAGGLALRDPRRRQPETTDLGRFLGAGAEAAVRQEPLLPVAQLLGLLGRHLDRPAGPPDRHLQLRARQDRAAHPAWLPAASTSGARPTTAKCPTR